MGFGLLFLGYFFLLSLPLGNLDLLPDIIGWGMMFFALKKLGGYCPDNRHFAMAKWAVLPAAAVSLVHFVVFGFFINEGAVSASMETPALVLQLGYGVLVSVFNVLLLLGIHKLSGEVELPKLSARARHLLALTAVYYIAQIFYYSGALEAMIGAMERAQLILNYVSFAIYLLNYLLIFLMLALLFSCYMHICLEGDEDMPYREGLLDRLFNKIRRK